MSFDVGPTKQKATDPVSTFGFNSLSMHDLQMMVDSEIRDVSIVIGLEVGFHLMLKVERTCSQYHSARDHFCHTTAFPLGYRQTDGPIYGIP